MSMQPIAAGFGQGGARLPDLKGILQELQGLKVSVIGTGAVANTKMDIAALRSEDTLLSAVRQVIATGATTDDVANCTIQPTKATGTVTFATAVDGNTFAVNGTTYTVKTTPTAATHVLLGGTDAQMATKAAAIVNAYENRVGGPGYQVVATSTGASGVVTFTSRADGVGSAPQVTKSGAPITISSTAVDAVTATLVSVVNTNAIIITPEGGGAARTFTAKTTPVDTEVDIAVLGTDTLQAAEFARVINAYEAKYGRLKVTASSNLGVVTIVPKYAKTGNAIPLAGTVTVLAASGTYLAGGTATGGIKSTTDNSASSLIVVWFNKTP